MKLDWSKESEQGLCQWFDSWSYIFQVCVCVVDPVHLCHFLAVYLRSLYSALCPPCLGEILRYKIHLLLLLYYYYIIITNISGHRPAE